MCVFAIVCVVMLEMRMVLPQPCSNLCNGRVSPCLWQTKVRSHPNSWKTVDHLLDHGCIWEVEHDRHCGEPQRKVNISIHIEPEMKNFRTSLWTIECLLTPVGHEDLHGGVLQQVSSGEDGPDLCEQPFSMKTFCVS